MTHGEGVASSASARRSDALRNRGRILEAARVIFSQQGASASTEAIAARAGVAIGTVFRHFPAKPDLLRAVVMDVWERLVAEIDGLLGDPSDDRALSLFCESVMRTAIVNRAVFLRLAETGTRVHVGDALQQLRPRLDVLLERAQSARVVRGDLTADELIVLLAALCQEAMTEGRDDSLYRRALTLLFEGIGSVGERSIPPS